MSFFVDPVETQIETAAKLGAEFIEIHTGTYANLFIQYHKERAAIGAFYNPEMIDVLNYDELVDPVRNEVERIRKAVDLAKSLGLNVNLGHGLTVANLPALYNELSEIKELHIGHSVVANSMFYGIEKIIDFYAGTLSQYKNLV